jgi:CRP-like cAMP-binding protein
MTHPNPHVTLARQLAGTVVGKYLSEAHIEKIVDAAAIRDLGSGEFLFREGESNPYLYVMIDGRVDLIMQVRHRGSQRILSLGRGDVVAWSSLLGNGTMTCSALCVRPAQLVAIDARIVLDRMEKDHEFGYHFMRLLSMALAHRLTATRLQLLDLFAPAT